MFGLSSLLETRNLVLRFRWRCSRRTSDAAERGREGVAGVAAACIGNRQEIAALPDANSRAGVVYVLK